MFNKSVFDHEAVQKAYSTSNIAFSRNLRCSHSLHYTLFDHALIHVRPADEYTGCNHIGEVTGEMEQIYPLREEVLSTYGGMPVAVIFKSGYREIGVIRSCQGGKLVLGNPYNSRPAYYGRGIHQDNGSHAAETDQVSQPIEAQPAAAGKKQGKKKKAKAAGVSHSPTKYASEGDNPSLSSRDESPEDTLKVDLDDIAYLFLIT